MSHTVDKPKAPAKEFFRNYYNTMVHPEMRLFWLAIVIAGEIGYHAQNGGGWPLFVTVVIAGLLLIESCLRAVAWSRIPVLYDYRTGEKQ